MYTIPCRLDSASGREGELLPSPALPARQEPRPPVLAGVTYFRTSIGVGWVIAKRQATINIPSIRTSTPSLVPSQETHPPHVRTGQSRLPQEPRRQRADGRIAATGRLPDGCRAGRRRSGGGQHLRVYRRRPGGILRGDRGDAAVEGARAAGEGDRRRLPRRARPGDASRDNTRRSTS